MAYKPAETRYDAMPYKRCGQRGLQLPRISLGLWYNFGGVDPLENGRAIVRRAFDLGVTHFDLANGYGPPPGSAEENFGHILASDLAAYRDELVISTKAGYPMWPGPYGAGGSRKYLVASLDQSLKRIGLDYVDIFYSHCPDPHTPMAETMAALDYIVRSGRALYVGISTYNPEQTLEAINLLDELGTPCLIHQPRYNMFDRWVEDGLLEVLAAHGVGCISFSPLCQGILTDKYVQGIPKDSRASRWAQLQWGDSVSPERLAKVHKLNALAQSRGQTLAQMAIAWVLRQGAITSALVGASQVGHVEAAVAALDQLDLSDETLRAIDDILSAGEPVAQPATPTR